MRSTSFALLLLLPLLGCDPGPDAEVVFGDVDELPGTLSYAVVEGSDPAAQNLQITNTGTCTLDYTIEAFTADQRPWLSATPTSGSVLSLGTATIAVNIASAAESLTPGTYTGTLAIEATCQASGNPAIGSPANVAVNLSVTVNNAILLTNTDALEFDVPDLSSGVWTSMSTAGAPADRVFAQSAWSGYEFYVAGGNDGSSLTADSLASVAAYNPSSDTWRNVADLATPVDSGVGLWADDRFIVLGGRSSASSVLTAERAQIYDPSSNTWAVAAGTGAALTERMALSCAVTDGDAVYFWGGRTAASTWVASDIGAVLDPSVDSTTALASAGQPDNDSLVYCALTGTEFLVVTDDQLGRYDLFTETWTTQSLPSSVEGGPCTWTGRELIVHEVTGPDIHVWNPTTDQWTTTSITDSSNVVPVEVTPHVWTGDVAIFLGLGSSDQYATFGPRTVTATGIGSDLNSGGRIVGMSHHWTGDRLLVFGGLSQASPLTVASGGAIFQ